MATGGDNGRLTAPQIADLAAVIPASNMTSIAESYLGINNATIKNLQYENKDNAEAFNREIIRHWVNRNPGNQIQRLTALLDRAATDRGYVDSTRVHEILTGQTEKGFKSAQTLTVAEDDLLEMAEALRIPMAKSMKMVPAPWIPTKVVRMEELYTELTLEKIHNQLVTQTRNQLENYKELFTSHVPGFCKYLDIRYYYPFPIPSRKILLKGGPGMGKTSLSKKISYDWAKNLFIKVSIVFFVFLKLVKPGDLIEDVIVQQMRKFQKKQIERKKLINILEHFGHRCLLILDGYDESALGQNENLTDILSGLKFENCNVLLTSRPHSTADIEEYFDTVVSVEGFTGSEARKFVSRFVDDKGKVIQILNFNPAGERSHRPVHKSPILLSFLCLLVVEDPDIDLSDKAISMGEIYFRMVQCLYKKFTIRKGIKFEKSSLVKVLWSLGELALETLLSGRNELERSKIIEEIGEDIFDYGLLIGQDGFSLTRDMTVDILVTFPHRSLQEFLGAFYFVLTLGKNQIVNHVDKAYDEYLKNPLFSEFCLWFLDESNTFLSCDEKSMANEMLNSYVTGQIDDVRVDFNELVNNFPALSLALVTHNETALTFLEDALGKCSKIKQLTLEQNHPNERILRSIDPFTFQRLKSIVMLDFEEKDEVKLIPETSPLRFLCERTDCSFDLTVKCHLDVDEELLDSLNTVLKFCESRYRSVHLRATGCRTRVLLLSCPSVRTLNVDFCRYKLPRNGIYPHLVNLFLTNCALHSRHLSDLAEDSAKGLLRKLSTLDISKNPNISGHLSVLLGSTFPSLHTLILSGCYLQVSDVRSLIQARREGLLPKLRHLDVSFNKDLVRNATSKSFLPLLFEQGISALDTLILRDCLADWNGLDQLPHQGVRMYTFVSALTALDMSRNRICGGFSSLICHYFPHLQILVLRQCEILSGDLSSLAQASNQGKLPELRHLDISLNSIGWEFRGICRLFERLKVFRSLINLILCDCGLELQDLCCLVQARLDGKLPRIRHLDISLNGLSDHVGILSRDHITHREISWENVICCERKQRMLQKERRKE